MEITVLEFTQSSALSVVQFATSFQNSIQYISGSRAMQEKLMTVTEVDENGSVNRLVVTNDSEHLVFMMDGDILMGAKQNRVLNSSVLLAPKGKTIIPVSCVEQGRWRNQSKDFTSTEKTVPHSIRAVKAKDVKMNLERTKMYDSNQAKVWSSVSEFSARMKHFSETSDLHEVLRQKEKSLTEVTEKFEPLLMANGMAVFIGSTLLNIDIFNQTGIYADYFPRLLKSAAADTMHQQEKRGLHRAEAEYKTLDFLDHINFADAFEHRGIGVGVERRTENSEMTGFELSYNKQPIHIALLRLGLANEREILNDIVN